MSTIPAPAPASFPAPGPVHPEPKSPPRVVRLAALSLAALGVVYGDIGTSPLYAFREAFNPGYGLPHAPIVVYGVLSLIVWSLVLVVAVKYIALIMRADNRGDFGQGALVLRAPDAVSNPFYLLAPRVLLSPLVVLATIATIVASQALISGAFSPTRQAVQLGLSPRLTVVHTSRFFAFMARNARSATEFFAIPPNRVVEPGMQIEF